MSWDNLPSCKDIARGAGARARRKTTRGEEIARGAGARARQHNGAQKNRENVIFNPLQPKDQVNRPTSIPTVPTRGPGDGPSQQHPHCGYETIHTHRERTETTSAVEEHPVNEDMEMDELLKTWKTQKKTKNN